MLLRVVSEITESNGSSSMATVCGTSLALMDAGVPLKAPVAGIAMGLIKEGDKFVVLTDILGDEDHLGDMDFKVAGTEEGITALQMDIKIEGITREIMQVALDQAREGRLHILGIMNKTLSQARTEISLVCYRYHSSRLIQKKFVKLSVKVARRFVKLLKAPVRPLIFLMMVPLKLRLLMALLEKLQEMDSGYCR